MRSDQRTCCQRLALLATLLMALAACDKVPTLSELQGERDPVEGQVPDQELQDRGDAAGGAPPTLQQTRMERPPQQIVDEFLATQPRMRTIPRLEELLTLDAKTLQQITRLDLQDSQVNDPGAALFARFPALRELNLSGTAITNDAMSEVAEARGVQVLVLDRMIIDGQALAALADHEQLREISLVNTPISDSAFRHLRKMSELEVLRVSGTRALQGHEFDQLVQDNLLPRLRELEASSTGFGYYGLRNLSKLRSLEVLRVADAQVSDAVMPEIAACGNLRELDLRRNPIGDDGLKLLLRLNQLETLAIGECPGVSDAGVNHLRALTSLKSLELNGCRCSLPAVQQLKSKYLPNTEIRFGNQVL